MGLWGNKNKEPENKDPQSKSEADLLVERLGASLDEKLKPLQETVTTLKSKWDALEAEAAKGNEEPPPDPASLTPEQRAANEKRANLIMHITTNARITEDAVLRGIAGKWAHLVPKIQAMFDQTSVERKAQKDYPQYCQNCVTLAVGQAAMEAGLQYDQKGGTFFIEDGKGGSAEAGGPLSEIPTWQDPVNGRVETPEQTLRKLGINSKDFDEALKREAV